MQIAIDSGHGYIINAYDDDKIEVNAHGYTSSFLITHDKLVDNWPVKSIIELNFKHLSPYLNESTELVLIGSKASQPLPYQLIQQLSYQRVGFECMNLDSACRTYSILNSEHRQFIAGFIF